MTLCEKCFRPAKFLIVVSAMPDWPLESAVCGYHTRAKATRPITEAALAEKAALDHAYALKFAANYNPSSRNAEVPHK